MEIKNKKLEKIVDWYFEPKGFEKSGKLYESLGVKIWSKYWPNQIRKVTKNRSKEAFQNYLQGTKGFERIHLLYLSVFMGLALGPLSIGDYSEAAWMATVGLIGNGYPIMSMRYNRNRFQKILKKLENRSKI